MHFWIDKRSQGCGFNGRHLVPPSISGSRHGQRLLCGGVHPKLMVTPVHRFQSIESVATGGVRHPRAPGYHARITLQCHPPIQINPSGSSGARNSQAVSRSLELLSNGQGSSVTPRNNGTQTSKLKCGVWAFFAIVTFFIAGAKYYFHGGNMGMEALAFCSLLVVILLVGGLVSLYEAISTSTGSPRNAPHSIQISNEQLQNETNEDTSNQVPNNVSPMTATELPPPPYHIAIMLPTQTESEPITILRDSPPPSYDKAVT